MSRAAVDFDAEFRRAQNATRGPSIWLEADDWQESAIPPRPWVVKGYFLRGSVTLIAGPGSAGKSSLTVGWAVAAALGLELGKFKPPTPLTCMLFNVEDDAEEQCRRLSAALRQHGATPAQVSGRVIRCGPVDTGTMIERDAQTGAIARTGAWDDLDAAIGTHKPDIVILDPFAELHTSEENDNTAVRAVVSMFRAWAQLHQVAVGIIHHTRKGAMAGEVDSVRGASAMVGAARVVLTVAPMSEAEAEELSIPKDQRRTFFRVDTPKSNYAPASDADWHELIEHELDNGEWVAAAHPWQPTGRAGQAPEARVAFEADIEAGSPSGPYSTRLSAEEPRSIGPLLLRHGITTKSGMQKAIKSLWDAGFSVQEFWGTKRRWEKGIRAPSGKPDGYQWLGDKK